MTDKIIIIASWPDEQAKTFIIQNLVAVDGSEFVPLFTTLEVMRRQLAGTGLEKNAIEIDLDLLATILTGDELLVLNPGEPDAMALAPEGLADPELRAFLAARRAA